MSEIIGLMDKIIEAREMFGYNYLDIVYNHNSLVTVDLNSDDDAVYCEADNNEWLFVKKNGFLKFIRFNGVDEVKLYV